MATKRKTAKDYRKELDDIKQQKIALENRISTRAKELCKKYPEIWVTLGSNCNANKTADFIKVEKLHVVTALSLIEVIEKELANQHPHKQAEIEFIDRDCISKNSPDGKCHYKDDSKYCYHCGLNQNYF